MRSLRFAAAGTGALAALLLTSAAFAQSPASSNNAAAHAQKSNGQGSQDTGTTDDHMGGIDSYPKLSFDTLFSVEAAGFLPRDGGARGPGPSLRFDSTALYEVNDKLSIDALFQFKPRQPLGFDDPNNQLFINQGAGRREGGKFKELYVRYGDYRIGKFVQDFGRAYALLPGPYAADFIEEADQGYELSDMIGVERIHVFGNEQQGWKQLSLSLFMFDRTSLHESFPYNEGSVQLRDGGVANTRYPENFMVTYDVLNRPVGHWGQLTYQASFARFGRSQGAERGELWGTAGADLAIPLNGSVESTLSGRYSQLRLYVEATRRENYEGFAGRTRDYLSLSAELLRGRWLYDLTTTQRWTTDRVMPLEKGELYTGTVGYNLPSQTTVSLSLAHERVADRQGVYAGLRLTQTVTSLSKALLKGRYF